MAQLAQAAQAPECAGGVAFVACVGRHRLGAGGSWLDVSRNPGDAEAKAVPGRSWGGHRNVCTAGGYAADGGGVGVRVFFRSWLPAPCFSATIRTKLLR